MNNPANLKSSVSVLVSTYNRAPYLRECLDSLLAQTRSADEIIVINDGSTDQTQQILGEYANRIVVIHQENTGKPRAINRAFERSRGEYLWIFDDDDVALPDSIERHAALLDTFPQYGFTYSSYLRGVDSECGRIVITENANVPLIGEDTFLIKLLETCFLTTQGMLMRRSVITSGYLFKPELIRSQDYELFIRLARNCQGGMIEGPSYIRRFHNGQRGSHSERFEINQIEEKWYQYEKIATASFFDSAILKEFLPKSLSVGSHEPQMQYKALAQKAIILTLKGLWDHLFQTIAEIGRLRSCGIYPSEETIGSFSRALRKDLAIQELLASPKLLDNFLYCLKNNLSAWEVCEWARGLWFSLNEHSNSLSKSDRRKSMYLVLRMLGTYGIGQELWRKLIKRQNFSGNKIAK